MRTHPAAALVALLMLVAIPAATAQLTRSTMTLMLEAPSAALTHDAPQIVLRGVATFTGDAGAYQNLNGIPISYHITKLPPWASAIVSPSTDVIPLPATPGVTFTASRPFEVVVILSPDVNEDLVGELEVAVTHASYAFNVATEGRGSVPIVAMATEQHEECPPPLTDEQMAALAVEAADAYNAYQASTAVPQDEPEEVSVQGRATPVGTPWAAAGGFALVGAGVGLVLKRRFHR